MKTLYRGYEITVTREECLGGWSMLYWHIVRQSDGWFAEDTFTDTDESVAEFMCQLKQRVDNELAEDDPWMERARRSVVDWWKERGEDDVPPPHVKRAVQETHNRLVDKYGKDKGAKDD